MKDPNEFFIKRDGGKITIDLDKAEETARKAVEVGAGVTVAVAKDAIGLGKKLLSYLEEKADTVREEMERANQAPSKEPLTTPPPSETASAGTNKTMETD